MPSEPLAKKPKEDQNGGDSQIEQVSPESALCLLEDAKPKHQHISELASSQNSCGMAWLLLSLCKKDKLHLPLQALDLTRCKLSPSKLFFLLDTLPECVEKLTLGKAAVRGKALPRLRDFLQRLEKGGQGQRDNTDRDPLSSLSLNGKGKEKEDEGGSSGVPCLKSLRFSAGSLKAADMAQIFPVIPSTVESLTLTGNFIDEKGADSLASFLRPPHAIALRTLILDRTGLTPKTLGIVCGALRGPNAWRPRIQTLSLEGNKLGGFKGLAGLCDWLRNSVLSFLRHLRLTRCIEGEASGVQMLAEVLMAGKVKSLEALDLQESFIGDGAAVLLGGALNVSCLPQMKHLDLRGGGVGEFGAKALISALASPDRPPLRSLHMILEGVTEEDAQSLGALNLQGVSGSLKVSLKGNAAVSFLTEVKKAPVGGAVCSGGRGPGAGRSLELEVKGSGSYETDGKVLSAFAGALRMGRLAGLKEFSATGLKSGLAKERRGLWEVLKCVPLPILSGLILIDVGLTDDDAAVLGEIVNSSRLSGLQILDLSENRELGKGGVEKLMNSVSKSERGLPFLEVLSLGKTKGGEGVGALGSILCRGKLPTIVSLGLESSGLDDSGMGVLGGAVRQGKLSRLRSLFLSQNRFGGGGMAAFFGALCETRQGFPFLENLSLSETSAGDGMAYLGASIQLGHLSRLDTLELQNIGLGNERLAVLGSAFGGNPGGSRFLSDLDLSSNPFDNDGLSAFLQALRPESLQCLQWMNVLVEGSLVEAGGAGDLFRRARGEGKLQGLDAVEGIFGEGKGEEEAAGGSEGS